MEDDARAFRNKPNMEKSTQRNSTGPIAYRKLFVIDGEPIEFEWNILPGLTSLEILQKIQRDLQDRNIEPENVEDWIILVSMFNDIEWTKEKGHPEQCISSSEKVKNHAKRFSRGHWTSLGPGVEKSNGMELTVTHLKENGILPPHRWWND